MKQNLRHFVCYLLIVPLFLACNPRTSTKVFNPAQVNFQVEYSPILENCLYPSYILGLNHHNTLKEDINLFSLNVTSPRDNAVLRIVIDSTLLNYTTIIQEVLPTRGERYTFHPSIKWKYDNLYATRKQGSVDFTFTCFINDEEVDIRNLNLNYRSVNECLLSTRKNGRTYDFRWLFAGYVNEDHPYIPQILSEILSQGTIKSFTGYQGNAQSVSNQVKAIWYYALNHGISYSSISCTSNPAPNTNVQHIRFFDEVYQNRQANCIDACVFFASIMRKTGLKPIIFVEPCHAYLGYYTDKNRRNVALLETTVSSWINFPDIERSLDPRTGMPSSSKMPALNKYLTPVQQEKFTKGELTFEDVKHLISDSLFYRATHYNDEDYRQNKPNFEDSTNIIYQQLIIEDLRQLVQPIN